MQISRNKTKAITIATFLVLTITASLLALPLANAHTPPQHIPTWTYVSVTPDTVGVNQPTLIVFWQNFCPPTANGAFGDRWYFYVDVTKPDGTTEVLGQPFRSDPVGGSWVSYTPTQIGTYTFVARFQEKVLNNQPGGMNPSGTYTGSSMPNVTNWLGDIFDASTSAPATLVVVQEPMQKYVETPLPTGYWTRPVYGTNQYWGVIMGQWLNSGDAPGRFNAYSQGPESAHIQWSRPYWSGGVMGGGGSQNHGNVAFYTGSSYESYGGPSLILEGKLYYSVSGGRPPAYGWYCVDLYTGKTLYYENNTDGRHAMPSMGEVLNMEYVNQHGGFAYLWRTSGVTIPNSGVNGTVWEMLDAFTGKSISKIANVSSTGTQFVDDIGSICYLNIANRGNTTNPDWRMTVWNVTHTMWYNRIYYSTSATNLYWEWRPASSQSGNPSMPLPLVFNGANGYSLNVTCPAVQGTIRQLVRGKYVIGGTTGNITTNPGQNTAGNLWALSLVPGKEGTLLWNFTFTPPAGLGDKAIQSYQFTQHDTTWGGLDADAGIFWYQNTMLMTRYVYSLDKDITGQDQGTLLWTGKPEDQWNFYGLSTGVYQGKLFNWGGYGGILTAYNATTGQKIWNWTAPYVGVGETPYTHTPLSLGCIAEGKLYMYTSEHSISQPTRRDAKIYCVDATTGKMLWAIPCWPSNAPIIADGRILVLDLVDNMIYCYGPGNSKTTVSAPQTVPALGSSVTLTGTVTDDTPTGRLNTNAGGTSIFDETSPATGDYDFVLKGTPAISDADQEAWMDYLFHQRPLPGNAKGVEVTLDAIDPNNNYIHIGTVTSDSSGNYGCLWKPEIQGTYQIIATFAGSKSYSASYSETYMSVGEAPPTPAEPQPEPAQPPLDMYLLYATVAIIVAIAIVGLLLLRKK